MECPNCQNQVHITEAQYGALFTCPQCQAVYFVGFDGTPQFEAAPQSPASEPLDLQRVETDSLSSEGFGINAILGEPNPNPTEQAFSLNTGSGQVDANASGFSAQDFFTQPSEPAETASPTPAPTKVLQRPIPQRHEIKKSQTLGDTLNEISDFGNSDVVGSMVFSVKIEGLDTRESVQKLFEALSDKKFNFVSEDLLKQIRNGELFIDGLNPVAAHVLAKRIQFLDLQSTWSFKNAI